MMNIVADEYAAAVRIYNLSRISMSDVGLVIG